MIKLAEILDEYSINKPIKSWKLNSDEYKSFYQLVTLCNEWNVDYGEEDANWDFSNDYYFLLKVFLKSKIKSTIITTNNAIIIKDI